MFKCFAQLTRSTPYGVIGQDGKSRKKKRKKVTVRKEKGVPSSVLVKRLKYTREQMAEIGQKTVKEGTDFMNGPETTTPETGCL